MDLNEIAIYIQVVKAGSFSGAAKKLGMPNSTVSSKISSLEKRLGTTLIQRTTRRLHITPAGQEYFKRCTQSLHEIESVEAEVMAGQGEPQGLLRVTAPMELGVGILPSIISEYNQKYPKTRIEVLLTDRRIDLVAEGVDLAIRAGELKDSSLISKKIGSACFVLVASPKYLKSKGTPNTLKDLRSHHCLQFTPLGIDEWKLTSSKGSFSVPVPGKVVINDVTAIKKMALMGNGIAYLPTHLCFPEIKSGELVRVLPEWRSSLNPLHFLYPEQKFVSPKLTAFMTLALPKLKETFAVADL